MMGLPPVTEIATGFQGGVAVKSHDCVTIGCNGWHNAQSEYWGMAGLRGQGNALGPEVRMDRQIFGDHAAYLAAQGAVLADPLLWLADPGADVPLPGDNGIRLVVVVLPSLLVAGVPGNGVTKGENQAQVLADLAANLLDGTNGTVQAIYGAASTTLWAQKDGAYFYDDNGSRALPDLVVFQRTLRLLVPEAQVETVKARAAALDLPPPDMPALDAAIFRAFEGWGEDTACLPGCGGVPELFEDQTTVNLGGDPFWVLNIWQIPAPGAVE